MAKAVSGKPVKWPFSVAVIAALLGRGHDVVVRYAARNLTRPEALRREAVQISNLLKQGRVLINTQHNPGRPRQVADAVRWIETQLDPGAHRPAVGSRVG